MVDKLLKECPFCGSNVSFDYTLNMPIRYSVICIWCDMQTKYFTDKETLIKMWNRRVKRK